MAQRQSRQEDMNRLALACVTAVTLAGGVVFGGVAGMTEDDAALSDVVVDEMMYTLDGEVENDDDVGIGLENDTRFSLLVSIFELYDVHPLKTYNFGKNMNMSALNMLYWLVRLLQNLEISKHTYRIKSSSAIITIYIIFVRQIIFIV